RPSTVGAFVAAAAILVAAFRPTPAASAAARPAEALHAGLDMMASRALVTALAVALADAPKATPAPAEKRAAAPSSARRLDKGQHRLRRSGRP
ncbi:MAG TPA: hypothetical protein VHB21_06800, partial [Minicystis sp.]|nr:hypothetical protein [Minicystis sp.]